MKLKFLLLALLVILLFFACKEIDHSMLHGKWKGHQTLIHDKVVDKGAELITFEFEPSGVFRFELAHRKQAGHFRTVEDKLLSLIHI